MIVSVSKIQSGSLDYFFTSHAHKQKIKGKYHIFEGGGAVPDKTIRKTLKFDLVQEGGGLLLLNYTVLL